MIHPAARELVDALVARDDERPRTQQTRPGFSSLGDCRRKVFHMIRGDAACNTDVERLPSILGTAIHAALEASDLPGFQEVKLYLPEIDMDGTADRINDGTLDDYKTTSLKNVDWVKENGPSRQNRWQVHSYAYAWNAGGDTDDEGARDLGPEVHTVRLIYIPRDGRSTDIHVHEEPYNPEVARDAIEWFHEVNGLALNSVTPEPEKDAAFCARFCQFYGDLCAGKTEIAKDEPEIDDPWVASAAQQYAEGIALEKRAKALKESARDVLEGVRGIAGGYRVGWVQRRPGEALDADQIRADYTARGEQVPVKATAGSEYPSVRAVKKAS